MCIIQAKASWLFHIISYHINDTHNRRHGHGQILASTCHTNIIIYLNVERFVRSWIYIFSVFIWCFPCGVLPEYFGIYNRHAHAQTPSMHLFDDIPFVLWIHESFSCIRALWASTLTDFRMKYSYCNEYRLLLDWLSRWLASRKIHANFAFKRYSVRI